MDAVRCLVADLQELPTPAMQSAVDRCTRIILDHGWLSDAVDIVSSRADMMSRWLHAALLEASGDLSSAESGYARVTDFAGCLVPDVLLRRARIMQRLGDEAYARELLCLAMASFPGYPFFVRAESLVKRCTPLRPTRRKTRVALLGSCTTGLFRPVLQMLLMRDGIEVEFYEGPFAAYRQEILSDNSELYAFGPEFVVLMLSWRDLGLSNYVEDAGAPRRLSDELRSLHVRLVSRSGSHVIQPSFMLPYDSFGVLSSLMPQGRTSVLREVNRLLFEGASAQVTILDTERMVLQAGGPWESSLQWSSGKLYPSTSTYPVLGEHVASCIRASLGLSAKVLALDLDNTLWGGIVGEDGLGGIRLGAPSAVGERYQELQCYVKGLRERGVLLTVVSKNNFADASEVFERHSGAVLKLRDFAAVKINWNEKVDNLRQLSAELSVGLDSFVFLDDNPAERARVRSELPEVQAPEISGEPSDAIGVLERGLYFQSLRLTDEDRLRNNTYAVRMAQEAARTSAPSVEAFLESLKMEVEFGSVDVRTYDRVAQLINKTNQFNLTSRRYTRQQVEELAQAQGTWFQWFRLRDRFGDHGLIGVLRTEQTEVGVWTIDLWLMSCRVIGRTVERFMFKTLMTSARRAGIKEIRARYIETPRNAPVRDLLPSMGFTVMEGSDVQRVATDVWNDAVDCARYFSVVLSSPDEAFV